MTAMSGRGADTVILVAKSYTIAQKVQKSKNVHYSSLQTKDPETIVLTCVQAATRQNGCPHDEAHDGA